MSDDKRLLLAKQAHSLVTALASGCSSVFGYGCMTASIYDTAWLSMLRKPTRDADAEAGREEQSGNSDLLWLFPESFDYIIKNQLPDGSWQAYSSPADGILNTSASLLAVMTHLRYAPDSQRLKDRAVAAEAALRRMLQVWDMNESDQVGLELLVVKLLHMLQSEGIIIDETSFPALPHLQRLHAEKLARLPKEAIYQNPSTCLHSLEAFLGDLDFDRLGCWREDNGSMMGSPASTAAYLMGASTWDTNAEQYLCTVLKYSSGRGDGSVPCAWPTPVFEVTWVLTSLLEAQVPIPKGEANTIRQLLEQWLRKNNGIVGFGPLSLPDADDSAKAITALHLLGGRPDIAPLLKAFEAADHFKTYQDERNPSFSANCNVLVCLLTLDGSTPYAAQISKTLSFLCLQAFTGQVREKWHTHETYWMMLFAHALYLLCERCSQDATLRELVFSSEDPTLRTRPFIIALQILKELLESQKHDGSWDDTCEVTAYAVLSMTWLSRIPCCSSLGDIGIANAIKQGQAFLMNNRSYWSQGPHMWVEKVTYGSPMLSESYCLAAMWFLAPPSPNNVPCLLPDDKLTQGMHKAALLISLTPLAEPIKSATLRVAEMQACYALEDLLHGKLDVISSNLTVEKYLFIVPLIWATCNSLEGAGIRNMAILHEMTVLSVIVYQTDHFMEAVVERKLGAEHFDDVRNIIRTLLEPHRRGHSTESQADSCQLPDESDLSTVKRILERLVRYILHHLSVKNSTSLLRDRLVKELEIFLLAHITQAADNCRFQEQHQAHQSDSSASCGNPSPPQNENGAHSKTFIAKDGVEDDQGRYYNRLHAVQEDGTGTIQPFINPGRSFYTWVRSTSADHSSCPFAFVFFQCLLGSPTDGSAVTLSGAPVWKQKSILELNARTAYLAEDLTRHLASMCRMYNDWGSMNRDAADGNVNSVNFPEFHMKPTSTQHENNLVSVSSSSTNNIKPKESVTYASTDTDTVRDDLMWIAEYERLGIKLALRNLSSELATAAGQKAAENAMRATRLFVDVTDLFGQVYVQKDLTRRIQK